MSIKADPYHLFFLFYIYGDHLSVPPSWCSPGNFSFNHAIVLLRKKRLNALSLPIFLFHLLYIIIIITIFIPNAMSIILQCSHSPTLKVSLYLSSCSESLLMLLLSSSRSSRSRSIISRKKIYKMIKSPWKKTQASLPFCSRPPAACCCFFSLWFSLGILWLGVVLCLCFSSPYHELSRTISISKIVSKDLEKKS